MALQKVAALIEYDGTLFAGYQMQRYGRTVQGELESAIADLSGSRVRVHGASRTDAGVHASGQVASFWIKDELPIGVVVRGLNHYLPVDIAIKGACVIDENFDVRRRAVSRVYRYAIAYSSARSPLRERFGLLMKESLDVSKMRLVARFMQGVHDFASFAGSPESTDSTVRLVHEARVLETGDTIEILISANSFLRHQVRNTVGQLIRVGLGRCSVDEFADLIAHPRKGRAGPAAPARGLCLVQIRYQPPLSFCA